MNSPEDRPLWQVRMLGQLQAEGAGRAVRRFATRKVAALFAYLAYYLNRPHPRELLIELLWPESDFEAGRKSLSVALTALRRDLEPNGFSRGSVLVADRFAVRLDARRVATD